MIRKSLLLAVAMISGACLVQAHATAKVATWHQSIQPLMLADQDMNGNLDNRANGNGHDDDNGNGDNDNGHGNNHQQTPMGNSNAEPAPEPGSLPPQDQDMQPEPPVDD